MEEPRNLERLASVETELKGIKEFLVRLDGKLDAWSNIYVPRQEINEMFRSRDKDIQDLKDNKKDSKYLWVAWVAVAVSIVSLVVTVIQK
jgi:hypothetical protein